MFLIWWATANSYQPREPLLIAVFTILKLLGKGDSEDRRIGDLEITATITLIYLQFLQYLLLYVRHKTWAYMSAFKCGFVLF